MLSMAQAMLNFFYDRYFSSECSCGLDTSNKLNLKCQIHSSKKPEIPENEKYVPKYQIFPENSFCKTTSIEINQSFPRQPIADNLQDSIEYRIKILADEDLKFPPGEIMKIKTNLNITRKPGKLSMLLKSCEHFPLRFISEGFINPAFRGKLTLHLQNLNDKDIYINSKSLIAYLIMSPFIQIV